MKHKVESVLREKYSRKAFIEISREILPFDTSPHIYPYLYEFDKDKYKNKVESFTVLGETEVGSKTVFLIEVKLCNTHIKRSPIFQRTVVAKFLQENDGDAAIAAFYSDDSEEWKYSLVDIEYGFDENGKTTKKIIGAKRYSFIVGPNVPVHTATEQISAIFGKENTFQDILTAFSIEKVSKDFFIKIASAFRKLVGGSEMINGKEKDFGEGVLTLPEKDKRKRQEFGIRLINRLIFCWFLKKKKTDTGSPLISDAVLSSRSVKEYRKNFKSLAISGSYYHDIVEPLFFEIMNKPEEERMERFKNINALNDIPFLNGGLFEPHKESDFYEFNKNSQTSTNINTLKVPDEWFEEFFETLERYNFTVDENTPVDIELSIDPEMLGRIFENLLAEINPETGETARKSTGSYYTPREIVEFMVTEALKYYLIDKTHISEERINDLLSYSNEETDFEENEIAKIIDALDSLKIIDPACGSGAFPIGILQKILLILQKIDPDNKKWFEKFVKKIPNALLQEEVRRKFKNENLDYVRKLAILKNSIYGVDIQPMATEISRLRAFLTLIVDAKVKANAKNKGIKPLPNLDFKFITANSLVDIEKIEPNKNENQLIKDPFFDNFKALTQKYFTESDMNKKHELRKKIEKLIDERVNEKLKHIDQLSRILDTKFEVSKKKKEKMASLNFEATLWRSYKNIFKDKPVEFFNPKYFFPEAENGFDIVIANPPYGIKYKKPIIDKLKSTYKFHDSKNNSASFFIEMAKNIAADSGLISYIIPKSLSFSNGWQSTRTLISDLCQLCIVVDVSKAFDNVLLEQIIIIFKKTKKLANYLFYTGEGWDKKINIISKSTSKLIKNLGILPIYITRDKENILYKIQNNSVQLSQISKTFRGLPLQNKISNYGNIPVLRGRNISKYSIYGVLDKVTNIPFNSKKIYMIQDKPKIVSQNIVAHTKNPREKIIIMATVDYTGIITLDSVMNTILTVPKFNYSYILSLLNSNLASWFYYWFVYNRAIRTMHFDSYYLGKLPIKSVSISEQQPFVNIVDKILSITQKEDYDPKADNEDNRKVKEYERQIDNLVYKLYDLTPEEIKIVEENTK